MKKLLIIVLLLSGCALQRAEMAYRAKSEIIGMSKTDLLMCAGVPIRQEKVDDLEFLIYSGGKDIQGAEVATATGDSNGATGVAVGNPYYYCEATFVLKDGTVQKVLYKSRRGGVFTKDEPCGFIVENCLK
jgi:hypothetical protein